MITVLTLVLRFLYTIMCQVKGFSYIYTRNQENIEVRAHLNLFSSYQFWSIPLLPIPLLTIPRIPTILISDNSLMGLNLWHNQRLWTVPPLNKSGQNLLSSMTWHPNDQNMKCQPSWGCWLLLHMYIEWRWIVLCTLVSTTNDQNSVDFYSFFTPGLFLAVYLMCQVTCVG